LTLPGKDAEGGRLSINKKTHDGIKDKRGRGLKFFRQREKTRPSGELAKQEVSLLGVNLR